ncbi:MAG: hypothetical protein WCW27_04155 [Patescibacteria group bacterium]|jgi:hypothetical protein
MYQLPKKELNEAYWIFSNRVLLRQIGYGILWFIVSVIWIITIYSFVRFVFGINSANNAQKNIGTASVNYSRRSIPQVIQVTSTDMVALDKNKAIVYILLTNPNTYHAATFDYTVTIAGKDLNYKQAQLMPGEQAYFTINDVAATTTAITVICHVTNTTWEQVNVNDLIATKKPTIKITETVLTPVAISQTNTNQATNTNNNVNANLAPNNINITTTDTITYPYTKLTTSLINQSIIGYHSSRVVAVITNNNSIIGIQEQNLSEFNSYAEKNIQMFWQQRFLANAQVQLFFYTDYIHSNNQILPKQQ